MPRNWFLYTIRAEGKDGTLGGVLHRFVTQRLALKVARNLAKGEALDDIAIVVMRRPEGGDRWDDQVIASFPFAVRS